MEEKEICESCLINRMAKIIDEYKGETGDTIAKEIFRALKEARYVFKRKSLK